MEQDRKARDPEPAESRGHAKMIRVSDPVRDEAGGVPALRAKARAAAAAKDNRRMTEDRRRKTEDGRQKTEDRRRRTEDGSRMSGVGSRRLKM